SGGCRSGVGRIEGSHREGDFVHTPKQAGHLPHSTTCLPHSTTCLPHSTTCLPHSTTCLPHSTTCLPTPYLAYCTPWLTREAGGQAGEVGGFEGGELQGAFAGGQQDRGIPWGPRLRACAHAAGENGRVGAVVSVCQGGRGRCPGGEGDRGRQAARGGRESSAGEPNEQLPKGWQR
ncbi:unnamed protein product, partial [Closterium sp. Naga37s-1]